jgi:hypothetical protein
MSEEIFLDDSDESPTLPRTMTHSRELVQYVNRFQTYPSNNSRSLALYIADFYNPQLGYAFPSQEKMATSFSTNAKTIRRWLKEIETTGYWIFNKGGKSNSTRYAVSENELRAVNRFLRAESRHERTGDDCKKVMAIQARNDNFVKDEAEVSETASVSPEKSAEAPQEALEPSNEGELVEAENSPVKTNTGDYEPSELPEIFPQDLKSLYNEMLYNGNVHFKHPAGFDQLNHRQTELIVTMISHLVHSHIIKDSSAPKIAKLMSDIWLAHPETGQDVFYNRTMHYLYKNNKEVASYVT